MSYIDSFLTIIKELRTISTELEFEEDKDTVKVTFSSKMGDFISFAKKDWVQEGVGTGQYHIMIKYEERAVLYKDLFTKKFQDDVDAFLIIRLNKKEKIYNGKESILVYFNLGSFLDLLKKQDFDFFMETNLQKFIFLPINNHYFNGIINIRPLTDYNESESYSTRVHDDLFTRLETIKEIYHDYGSGIKLPTPLSLRFKDIKEKDMFNLFKYSEIIITCKYLANKCYEEKLIFKGYQSIELNKGEYFIPTNTRYFSRLFDFVFDQDKYVDKVEIARNVFSLYLSDDESLQDLDASMHKIQSTIEDHFTSYIQDKIKKFFDQRKDLVKEAYSAANEAKETSDKIIANINLLVLGLVTASLTGVFAYSKGDKFIFLLALIFHTLYFAISFTVNIINLRGKRPQIKKSFDDYVDQFSVLKSKEVEKIKSTYLEPALKRLSTSLGWYTGISIFLIVIMLVASLFLGLSDFNNGSNKQNNNQSPQTVNQQQKP